MDALAAKLVNAFRLAHKHDLELLAVRVVVDVFGDAFINQVVLDRDVDCDAGFQVDNVVAEHIDLGFVLMALLIAFFQLS